MITSIDVGIKNFGIFITDNSFSPVYLDNINLSPYSINKLILTLDNLFLEKLKQFDFNNQTVLIEQQIVKNNKVFRVSCNLEIYFKIRFNSDIIFCNSKNKDLKKSTNYKERKKNSIEKCTYFLNTLEDKSWLNKINTFKKKDDIGDAICQFIFYFKINR